MKRKHIAFASALLICTSFGSARAGIDFDAPGGMHYIGISPAGHGGSGTENPDHTVTFGGCAGNGTCFTLSNGDTHAHFNQVFNGHTPLGGGDSVISVVPD